MTTDNPTQAAASDPKPTPTRRGPSLGPLLFAGLGLLILIGSGTLLSQRIQAYNQANVGPIYRFIATDRTEFEFAEKQIAVVDEVNEAGEGTITVTYGEAELVIPVEVPNEVPFPGLDRYADWFRILIFAQSERMSNADFEANVRDGTIQPRLVFVTRNPLSEDVREGRFNLNVPENWATGETHRDRWTFTFHEALPAGGFESHTLRFPESGKSFYRRQIAAEKAGDPPPERDPDELVEGTWEFQAALPLMNRPPAITMERQALRNAGWTLPVASFSVLMIMFGIAWAFAPARTTQ